MPRLAFLAMYPHCFIMNKTIIECYIHTHATKAEIDLSVLTLRLNSAAAVTSFRILPIHFQQVFIGGVIKVAPFWGF